MTYELEILVWLTGLTIIMWLPYIVAHIANVGLMEALMYRADGEPLLAWGARAKRAHYNAIENLVPFVALVIAGHVANVNNDVTASAALAFFGFVLLITSFTRSEYHLFEHLLSPEVGWLKFVSWLKSYWLD